MLDDIRTRITALLADKMATKAILARHAGIHRNSLLGIDRPGWNPSMNTVKALVKALDRLEKPDADGPTPAPRKTRKARA